MKLVKAYIDNFGKFHNQEFDFNAGLNAYTEENGWGKTTLADFITAMFYGMEHSTKRDIRENEKKRYDPWQGGTYGGFLSFEHNGKQYQVSRTFGMKKNEDTFVLLDLKTNKPSTAFSENLGEELFGVSRDTFERSAHVTLEVTPSGSTDISARLNNLVEAGDMGNYDEAKDRLENRAKTLVKYGGKGYIADIQAKIDGERELLQSISSKEKANEEISYSIGQLQSEIDQLQTQQDAVSAQMAVWTRYEQKQRYEDMKSACDDAKEEYERRLQFFHGEIPSETEMKRLSELVGKFTTVSSNLQNQSASQSDVDDYKRLKDFFAGDIPQQAQIDACLAADREYNDIQQQKAAKVLSPSEGAELNGLRQKFAGKTVSAAIIAEKLRLLDDIQSAGSSIAVALQEKTQKEAELQAARQIKPKNTRRVVFLALGAAALIIGGAVCAALHTVSAGLIGGGAVAALGLVCIILGLLSKAPIPDFSDLEAACAAAVATAEELQRQQQVRQTEVQDFISALAPGLSATSATFTSISVDFSRYENLVQKENELSRWAQSLGGREAECVNLMKGFMSRYCKTDDISRVTTDVQTLIQRLNRLRMLETRINADTDNVQSRNELDTQLSSAFSQYQVNKAGSYSDQLNETITNRSAVISAKQTYSAAANTLALFESQNAETIATLADVVKPEKDQAEYQADFERKRDEIINKKNELNKRQSQLDDNLAVTDRRDDIETEMERLTEQKKELQAEYDILKTTLELLAQAKENLDANYSDPMKEGFTSYIERLGSRLPLVIDTDLQVSVNEKGKLYDSDYLSAGYKDLVNFCSRMALIDALFTETKPPVLIDDPFVNLDDEKIPPALALIKEMADEKQILYFTCHNSRAL